jgi:chromosome segregation ATPase
MDPSKLRIRRKTRTTVVDARAPAIAKQRTAEARLKIEAGIDELRLVLSWDALSNLMGLKSVTLEGFLQWKGLGNDTLYKTHSDLLVPLKQELSRIRQLRQRSTITSEKKKKRWTEVASLRARLSEAEALLSARNKDCADLISQLESARREIRQLKSGR